MLTQKHSLRDRVHVSGAMPPTPPMRAEPMPPMRRRLQPMASPQPLPPRSLRQRRTPRPAMARRRSRAVPSDPPRPPRGRGRDRRQAADVSLDVTQTLARLADLRDSGAITAEEYEAKKQELLGRL